eukprot:gene26013-31413_t
MSDALQVRAEAVPRVRSSSMNEFRVISTGKSLFYCVYETQLSFKCADKLRESSVEMKFLLVLAVGRVLTAALLMYYNVSAVTTSQDVIKVLGVEANHHLTAHFEYSDATKAYRDRAIVIPAAVSTKRGTATFNTGGGWQNNMSDVGSLFGWEDPRREAERKKLRDLQQTVRLIALSDILVHVAPPVPPLFMWDTFKVDIQGSDVEALITAEGYLKNFVCVVGEFQSNHYKIPDGVAQDPAPILTAADFVKVYHKDNQIWMNKRYSKEYLANPELFGCHRVYDSKVEAAVLAKEFTRLIA